MFHHHHHQHAHHGARVTPAQRSDLAQRSTSEIEAFRARQRMQLRYGHATNQHQHQQVFPYAGTGPSSSSNNQTDAHYHERMHDCDDDTRVRKLSLTKRRQQQQQQQQQQQSLPSQPHAVKMPNFGGGRQFDAYHTDTCADMASPVPFASHAMFNAFDYGDAPETFGDANHSDHAMHAHGSDADEKSLWRRRFAASDEHERRSPKLGKVALWDSPCGLDDGDGDGDENNQFSHELQHIHPFFQHHQHLYQFQMQ